MNATLFVLGGNDGEMETIKNILSAAGISFVQPVKGWGPKEFGPYDLGLRITQKDASPHYSGMPSCPQMVDTIEGEPNVIFVECGARDWPEHAPKPFLIDHHFGRSGEPASLTQVIAFLRQLPGNIREHEKSYGSPVSQTAANIRANEIEAAISFSSATQRWMELVSANDARYIPGMMAIGATQEEIDQVRAFDRRAQGITCDQEAEGERAIGEKKQFGRLTVNSKTATVADRIFGQYDQLLILSGDGEVNFFGDGALCAELRDKFEGWNGGSGLGKAGENAYWGGFPNQTDVLDFIATKLA